MPGTIKPRLSWNLRDWLSSPNSKSLSWCEGDRTLLYITVNAEPLLRSPLMTSDIKPVFIFWPCGVFAGGKRDRVLCGARTESCWWVIYISMSVFCKCRVKLVWDWGLGSLSPQCAWKGLKGMGWDQGRMGRAMLDVILEGGDLCVAGWRSRGGTSFCALQKAQWIWASGSRVALESCQ